MPLRDSRVVVTGGAGFVGSHLVDALVRLNNEVIVVDDLSSGRRENLSGHARVANVRFEQASVLDGQAMIGLLRGARYVFHLAARNVRLSLRQPSLVHEVNSTGTLNVLKAAAAAGVEKLLYCSSSEVNGTADVVPMPEDYHFRPETIYGASKLAGEYYTQVFERAGWLRTVIVRPHNNYGPREHFEDWKGEVIPRFILWALAGQPLLVFGNGMQTRDFTYVVDTAEIMISVMACQGAHATTLNICRGEEVSIRDIASLITTLTGASSAVEYCPARPSDVLRLCGDSARLRAVVGKVPLTSIREGLARTVAWFRENVPIGTQVLESLKPENWMQVDAEEWMLGLPSMKRQLSPSETDAP